MQDVRIGETGLRITASAGRILAVFIILQSKILGMSVVVLFRRNELIHGMHTSGVEYTAALGAGKLAVKTGVDPISAHKVRVAVTAVVGISQFQRRNVAVIDFGNRQVGSVWDF